jgi:hypothetical protein
LNQPNISHEFGVDLGQRRGKSDYFQRADVKCARTRCQTFRGG